MSVKFFPALILPLTTLPVLSQLALACLRSAVNEIDLQTRNVKFRASTRSNGSEEVVTASYRHKTIRSIGAVGVSNTRQFDVFQSVKMILKEAEA